jgi:hypothetical protein
VHAPLRHGVEFASFFSTGDSGHHPWVRRRTIPAKQRVSHLSKRLFIARPGFRSARRPVLAMPSSANGAEAITRFSRSRVACRCASAISQ